MEPRVGHPTHNCYFCLFFLDKKCIYSVADGLYEPETFQTRASTSLQRQARVKRAWKLYCARSACSSIASQLRHEVTKKAIKAVLKLCMHVICYIWLWVAFKNMEMVFNLKWFSKLSWSSPALSPSSNTPDSTRQLINRDWNGSEKVKRVKRKYDACQILVTLSSDSF